MAELIPDFGMHLYVDLHLRMGTLHRFNRVLIDHISIIDRRTLSFTVETARAGQRYAATFDIHVDMAPNITAKLMPRQQTLFDIWIRRMSIGSTFDIIPNIHVDIVAKFGTMQLARSTDEEFLPFIVQGIT